MEIKFKYRPEVTSIEDLQPGDEFLVGDERWKATHCYAHHSTENAVWLDSELAKSFIRANVPIERDIPYPEGGAEKWELREGDGVTDPGRGAKIWRTPAGKWANRTCDDYDTVLEKGCFYAIPKAKPQDKAKPAPKEYTVSRTSGGSTQQVAGVIFTGTDFKPGDRVTVQRVEK
jgi:hypothetical protein